VPSLTIDHRQYSIHPYSHKMSSIGEITVRRQLT